MPFTHLAAVPCIARTEMSSFHIFFLVLSAAVCRQREKKYFSDHIKIFSIFSFSKYEKCLFTNNKIKIDTSMPSHSWWNEKCLTK